nr:MAG TPA: hypothetical protein [Caudoviricetes sp.]
MTMMVGLKVLTVTKPLTLCYSIKRIAMLHISNLWIWKKQNLYMRVFIIKKRILTIQKVLVKLF